MIINNATGSPAEFNIMAANGRPQKLVNPSIPDIRETEIRLHGAKIKSGKIRTFHDQNIRNFNNLDNSTNIQPREESGLLVKNGTGFHNFKNASVTVIELELI